MLCRHFLVSVRWGTENTISFHFPQPTNLPRIIYFNSGRAKHTRRSPNLCSVSNYQIKWSCGEIKFSSYNRISTQKVNFLSSHILVIVRYIYTTGRFKWFLVWQMKSLTFSVTIIQCNFSSLSATQLIGL